LSFILKENFISEDKKKANLKEEPDSIYNPPYQRTKEYFQRFIVNVALNGPGSRLNELNIKPQTFWAS
jgi:hypothetical protein